MKKTIRVGNAQAFWGDRPSAAFELLAQEPDLDYLTMDYLAEVSMSILALQRERDPKLGYAQDFVEVVRGLAEYWAAGGKCRLIANAGGLNPLDCARACIAALEEAGCRSLTVGVVSGDDVLAALTTTSPTSDEFQNLDTSVSIATVRDQLVNANAGKAGDLGDPGGNTGDCAHLAGRQSRRKVSAHLAYRGERALEDPLQAFRLDVHWLFGTGFDPVLVSCGGSKADPVKTSPTPFCSDAR